MKTTFNPISQTVATLRENAKQFNHVADLLEAGEKISIGNGKTAGGILGPRLVRKTMSISTRRKIAKAAKARNLNKGAPTKAVAA